VCVCVSSTTFGTCARSAVILHTFCWTSCTDICLKGLRKAKKRLRQDSRSPGRDVNLDLADSRDVRFCSLCCCCGSRKLLTSHGVLWRYVSAWRTLSSLVLTCTVGCGVRKSPPLFPIVSHMNPIHTSSILIVLSSHLAEMGRGEPGCQSAGNTGTLAQCCHVTCLRVPT
jgi:hypothetical protein